MATKLTVRKEYLGKSISYQRNGYSYDVPLTDASQEQLLILKELGLDIFEVKEADKK